MQQFQSDATCIEVLFDAACNKHKLLYLSIIFIQESVKNVISPWKYAQNAKILTASKLLVRKCFSSSKLAANSVWFLYSIQTVLMANRSIFQYFISWLKTAVWSRVVSISRTSVSWYKSHCSCRWLTGCNYNYLVERAKPSTSGQTLSIARCSHRSPGGGNLLPNSCGLIQSDCNHSQTEEQLPCNLYRSAVTVTLVMQSPTTSADCSIKFMAASHRC